MRVAKVFLIEDDSDDIEMFEEFLLDNRISLDLEVFRLASDALEVLRASKDYPDFILLDLNLPGMTGGEFLKILKADSELREIPVIVLSTSRGNSDIVNTFRDGISSYIIKPPTLIQFLMSLKSIESLWLGLGIK